MSGTTQVATSNEKYAQTHAGYYSIVLSKSSIHNTDRSFIYTSSFTVLIIALPKLGISILFKNKNKKFG
jgi:hypothetical protein